MAKISPISKIYLMMLKTIDKIWAFKAAIDAMRKSVFVGVPQDENSRSGQIGNASLAYIHEKGSPAANIPARPFMGPGVKAVQSQIEDALSAGAKAAFLDTSAINKSLNKTGLIAQSSIKKTIVAGSGFAPLKQSTLAARKRRGLTRTKPLIDTASLLNSISYAVK